MRDPADRRTVILVMTKPGERLLTSAPSLLQTRLSQELKRIPEADRKALLRSLLTVAELMESEMPEELTELTLPTKPGHLSNPTTASR
jgi:DNA-binding MarR family transcriptional regulator